MYHFNSAYIKKISNNKYVEDLVITSKLDNSKINLRDIIREDIEFLTYAPN